VTSSPGDVTNRVFPVFFTALERDAAANEQRGFGAVRLSNGLLLSKLASWSAFCRAGQEFCSNLTPSDKLYTNTTLRYAAE